MERVVFVVSYDAVASIRFPHLASICCASNLARFGKRIFFVQGEENYLYSLVRMTLEQLPKLVQDDQEVGVRCTRSIN